MKTTLTSFLFLLLFIEICYSSDNSHRSREVIAYKLNEEIILDGKLNEKIYQNNPITNFFQHEPDEGKEATEKTEVWVSYNEHYFFVSAKLFDSRPDSITKILGRRDQFLSSDYFGFAIDTYFDRRNAYFFIVNPVGSIIDGQFFNDSWEDETWDGVWDYAVSFFDSGWAVEIKIPFSQLRFKDSEELLWGINFYRRINRKNEEDFFVYVPKNQNGFVSHFAVLIGLKNIKQKQRIEFLPYIVSKAQYLIHDPKDPFYKQNMYKGNLGGDFKIGVGSNITIDGTFNPDFGQVEVDPAVINLTAFETYFVEKRPFFIEGSQILRFGIGGTNNNFNINWSNPQIFYSRRIGRPPRMNVNHSGYVNYPSETRILGAAKLSGKIRNDWSINFLNAFTERTYATIDSAGIRFKEEIEPFTYYGVLRSQKEFSEGKSAIGIIGTGVIRDNSDARIKYRLVNNAFTFGVDGYTYLDENDEYILTGYLVSSHLKGSRESISLIQKAPQRYLQRPDLKNYSYDSTMTNMSGYGGRVVINKQKGNFIFNYALGFIDPYFEINDLGFLSRADVVNSHLVFGYRWFNPDGLTRNKRIMLALFGNSDFDGNLTFKGIATFGGFQLMNFYLVEFDFGYAPDAYDKYLTRGGPLTKRPSAYWYSLFLGSDRSKNIVFDIAIHKENTFIGSKRINSFVSIEWKPWSQFSFSFSPNFEYSIDKTQWIRELIDSSVTRTYGRRYIFARINQQTISADLRLNYAFTPKLTLQLYLQPFISVGRYDEFKELCEPKTYNFSIYGKDIGTIKKSDDIYLIDPDAEGPENEFAIMNPDFNFKSFKTNLVLRWEFAPGSAFYFVWSHNRINHTNPGSLSISRDLKALWNSDADNIFSAKLTYWLDL